MAPTTQDPYIRPETLPNVGALMREARLKKGVSVANMAAELGVNESAIRLWELGTHNPTLPNFWAFCHALNVDPGKVLSSAYRATK